MRCLRLIIPILALAVTITSCSPEDPFVTTVSNNRDTIKDPAFLRFIHASPTGPKVDVLLNGAPMFSAPIGYFEFPQGINDGKYYPVDTASKSIAFTSGAATLASGALAMKAGEYYTVYFYGETNDYRSLVTNDSIFPTPDASKTRLRLVNFASDSPPLEFRLEAPQNAPIVSNLTYGQASDYVVTASHAFGHGTGLYVFKSGTDTALFGIDPPYVVLPGSAVFTLVMAGKARPRGDDPFLFFEAFQENSKTGTLYGSIPLPITFAAIRFANLTSSGDSLLDVSIFDPNNADYAANEHFRRNYPGQWPSVIYVAPLGYSSALGLQPMKPYFLMNAFSFTGGDVSYPYRIEVNASKGDPGSVAPHPTLIPKLRTAPGIPFTVHKSSRYTIVAYGPFDRDQARTLVLTDNTPRPSSGKSRLRFFNGGYGDLIDKRLEIRIDGVTTKAMSYGEVPVVADASATIEVSPGDAKQIELIDAGTGQVIFTEQNVKLSPDKAYTVYLSRGKAGSDFVLTAVSEDLDSQP